ncbi:MAG: hypothetical protein ABI619_09280 [Betaproteobacteria bacterium]
MERISVSAAGSQFDELVARVSRDGVTVELEQDNLVVARISPVEKRTNVSDLNRIFATFPPLGDEAETFAKDLDELRQEIPRESDPWA